MSTPMNAAKNPLLALCCAALLTSAACGDDDKTDPVDSEDAGNDPEDSGGGDGEPDAGGNGRPEGDGGGDAGAPEPDPVYLIQLAIYGADETLNYVLADDELDFDIDTQRLKSAREFAGYTGIAAIGGYVVAADGAAPFINKYEILDDLSWKDAGRLNFSAYPMDENNYMNFYFQSIKDDDNVYFYYGTDKTSRVHWSVKDWKIVKAHQDTNLPTPEAGWLLQNGGNRTAIQGYEEAVVQPFFIANEETGRFTDSSWLAVYDPQTHEEKDVIEVPCPGIQQVTRDEEGNLYFSTTFNLPTLALYGKSPAPCIVKVKPNGTLDDSFAPNDLTEWTGGFYGVNFRYLGKGKAIANVLHHDRLGDVDFSGDVDPEVELKIAGGDTDSGYQDADATIWDIHLIDLEQGTSEIVSSGFKPEHDLASYTTYAQVDGRTFITVQLSTETTRSAIYELDLDKASVKPVGEMEGDLWGVMRLR
jgi:hypothetical protein